jgi:23S rRNA maturation-related 3'-5' exoribonuclease YhaM
LVEQQFPKQELLPKGKPNQQNKRELSMKEIDQQLKHYLLATENKLLKVKIKGVKKYFY